MKIINQIESLFENEIIIKKNIISVVKRGIDMTDNQGQTTDIFSDKWLEASEYDNIDKMYSFQLDWFLKLYGFNTREILVEFLKDKQTIINFIEFWKNKLL